MACVDTTNHSRVDSTALKKLSSLRVDLHTKQSNANLNTEMITFYTLNMDGAVKV